MVREERRADVVEAADHAAVERVIDLLYPDTRVPSPQSGQNPFAALGSIFGQGFAGSTATQTQTTQAPPDPNAQGTRDTARSDVLRGFYDVRLVDIEIEEAQSMPIGVIGGDASGGQADIGEMLGGLLPKRRVRKRVTVAEARRIFAQEEEQKLIDMDAVK